MVEWNTIKYIDCMNEKEGLPSLPDKSIDVIFFDPPYNAKKNYGIYKDNLPPKIYLENMKLVVQESKRISKKGIGVYVDSYRFKLWVQKIFPDAYPIIIWKRSPGFKNKQNIHSSYHVILTNIKANKGIPGFWYDLHPVSDGYWWRLTKDYVSKTHPAQTSLEIVLRFINLFTNKKDVVLDPFIGTGTTAQACIKMGRFWVGYEIDKQYKDDIEKRLKNCKKESEQTKLF